MTASSSLNAGSSAFAPGFLEHLGVADIAFLVVLALSVLAGMLRGFSRETGGVLVWAGALWSAFRVGNGVVALVDRTVAPMLRDSGLFHGAIRVGVFVFSLIVLSLIARLVAAQARAVLSGGIDAVLGAAFGLLRGYVLLVLFFLLLEWMAPNWLGSLLHGSVLGGWILRGVSIAQGYLPPEIADQLHTSLENAGTLLKTKL